MSAESVRVALYLPMSAEQVARDIARKNGISRNAVFRRALGLLQAFEAAADQGHYVGTTRDREQLDTVIVAPV